LNRNFTYTKLPLLRRSEYRYDERSAATGLNAIFTPKNCVRAGKKNLSRRNPCRLGCNDSSGASSDPLGILCQFRHSHGFSGSWGSQDWFKHFL